MGYSEKKFGGEGLAGMSFHDPGQSKNWPFLTLLTSETVLLSHEALNSKYCY